MEKQLRNAKITIAILFLFFSALMIYFFHFYKPKNSLDLYQSIRFSKDYEDALKLSLNEYEEFFSKESYENIVSTTTEPSEIHQFTVLQYHDKSILVETTPGTYKLQVLRVVEIPNEFHEYLKELPSN